MPKYSVQTHNPARYRKVKPEQEKLLEALIGQPSAVRLCPYCDRKLAILYPGYHGPEVMKCPTCAEPVVFPAVKVGRTITSKA